MPGLSEQEEFEFRRRREQELTAQQAQGAPTTRQPMGVGEFLKEAGRIAATGVGDVAVSALRGTVNRPTVALRGAIGGIVGAIDPTITARQGFQQYADQARADIEAGRGIVGSERLRTPEGAALASAIGQAPGFQQAGTALQRLHEGAQRLVGPELTQVGEAGLELGLLKGAGGVAERLGPAGRTGGRLASEMGTGATADALAAAERMGYTPTPTTVAGRNAAGQTMYAGTKTERTATGVGGAEQVNARIAVRNQTVTDRAVARAAQLGEEFPTPANVARATDEANKAYDALKTFDVEVPLSNSRYITAVSKIDEGVAGFKGKPLARIEDLKDELLTAEPTLPNMVDKVRSLREHSYRNRSSHDPDLQRLGQAERQAADILDGEIDNFLKNLAQTSNDPNLQSIMTRLYSEYTNARAHLSTLHDVRDAMNSTTGSIDAAVLAKLAEDHPLNPGLQAVADAYNTIGADGMRNIQRAARIAGRPLTVGDAAMGVVGANAAYFMAGPTAAATAGAIASLGPAATRLMLREYALRGRGARAVQNVGSAGARIAGAGAALSENVGGQQ